MRRLVHSYRLLLATVATVALASPTAAMTYAAKVAHLPTTADLGDTGPEDPAGGQYGVQHPSSSFEIGVVPVSYDFAAHGVRWTNWGSPVAVGRGTAHFCVIMSPCHSGVSFVMAQFDPRLVSCGGSLTHYSYTRFRMHLSVQYQPHPFTEEVHVGCVTR